MRTCAQQKVRQQHHVLALQHFLLNKSCPPKRMAALLHQQSHGLSKCQHAAMLSPPLGPPPLVRITACSAPTDRCCTPGLAQAARMLEAQPRVHSGGVASPREHHAACSAACAEPQGSQGSRRGTRAGMEPQQHGPASVSCPYWAPGSPRRACPHKARLPWPPFPLLTVFGTLTL